jgi:hypothetical protein
MDNWSELWKAEVDVTYGDIPLLLVVEDGLEKVVRPK